MQSLFRSQAQQAAQIEDLEIQDIIPVVARYTTAAGQNLANNTLTIVDFGTLVIDTYAAVGTGAGWSFTAPVAGYYQIDVSVMFTATAAWAVSEVSSLAIYKNTAVYSVMHYDNSTTGGTVYRHHHGSDIILLAKGDVVDFRVLQVSGGALTLIASAIYNFVAIHRIK